MKSKYFIVVFFIIVFNPLDVSALSESGSSADLLLSPVFIEDMYGEKTMYFETDLELYAVPGERAGVWKYFMLGGEVRNIVNEDIVNPDVYAIRLGLTYPGRNGGFNIWGGFQPHLVSTRRAWVSGGRYWTATDEMRVVIQFDYSENQKFSRGFANFDISIFGSPWFFGAHLSIESNGRFWGGFRFSGMFEWIRLGIEGKVVGADYLHENLEEKTSRAFAFSLFANWY